MFQQQPQPATERALDAHEHIRNIIRDYKTYEADCRESDTLIDINRANLYKTVIKDLEAILPRPTLAELIDQGHDPDDYQWMQADHANTDERVIITRVWKAGWAEVLWRTGERGRSFHDDLTPRPDLPPMKWPDDFYPEDGGEEVPTDPGESVADYITRTDRENAQHRPEDVPEGEVWMIRPAKSVDPVPAFRVHQSKYGPGKRWAHYRIGGSMLGFADDEDVTLLARMVPDREADQS